MVAKSRFHAGGWLITCEHAVNRVPRAYRDLFRGRRRVLTTHRAFDYGALQLAKRFASRLEAQLVTGNVTRLLVDLNRSLSNPSIFSEF